MFSTLIIVLTQSAQRFFTTLKNIFKFAKNFHFKDDLQSLQNFLIHYSQLKINYS